jgi:antitoxin (DNA-binding transcriptional repressor) of toxin-antitoxin stability system
MMKLSIREARQSLSSIEQILTQEGGVTITRRGKEIARVIPINRVMSIPSHSTLRQKTPRQTRGSEVLVSADRDER